MESTSEDAATLTTKMLQSGVSGSLQYLNPDYMPPSVSSTLVSSRSSNDALCVVKIARLKSEVILLVTALLPLFV